MTLVLIRHGEAESNATGVIGGWQDYPLTERGRDQARRAAARLASSQVDAIYASDLSRAAETARIIAEAVGCEVVESAAFRERSWGDAEGLTREQIAERFGRVPRGQGHIPNEELYDAFLERLMSTLNEVHERHRDERVLVVSHAGTVIGVLASLFRVAPGDLPRIAYANTGFTVIESIEPPLFSAINDHAHLE